MELITIPTEQTTAATDALMAVLCLAGMVFLQRFRSKDPRKIGLWTGLLGLLAMASILGTIVHGFVLPKAVSDFLWQPLYLSLGLAVALFVVAVVHDRFGPVASRQALPWMIAAGFIFFGITFFDPESFQIFIMYEAVAMIFALLMYGTMAIRKSLPGAGFMTLGILLSIVAAAIQAGESMRFTLIWTFDFNGIFHIVQMVGVIVLLEGIRRAMKPART